MLTRRGFFKGLLGLVGAAAFLPVPARAADPVAHLYTNTRTLQDCICGKRFCYDAAALADNFLMIVADERAWPLQEPIHFYVDGVLLPPGGSVYIGAAGRLHLPPGRLYFRHSGAELTRGRSVHPRAELIFVPTVCLTDAEHARLQDDAAPFNIAIQKGCEA